MNKIKLNEKFELSRDLHNWTLGEIRVTENMTYSVNTYHANPQQVAHKIMKLCDTTDVSDLDELMIKYQEFATRICISIDKAIIAMEKSNG